MMIICISFKTLTNCQRTEGKRCLLGRLKLLPCPLSGGQPVKLNLYGGYIKERKQKIKVFFYVHKNILQGIEIIT